MACSVCGDAGHNRRTHQDHPVPQAESLLVESGPEVVAGLLSEVIRDVVADPASPSITIPSATGPIGPGDIRRAVDALAKYAPVVGAGEPVTPQISSADFDDVQVEEDPTLEPDPGYDRLTVVGLQPIDDGLSDVEPFVGNVWHIDDEPDVAVGAVYTPWRTYRGPDEPIRITEPGVYELTAEEYHDPAITGDWFSNSDGKKLLETCPAQFKHDRDHSVRKTSDAFDFGHVWHALILGKGEAYRVFEPKKLDGRTKEGKAQKAEVEAARAAGITPIYGDQFALIKAMADAVLADPKPRELLTAPGRQEVCLFWRQQIKVTDPHNSLYGQVVTVQRRAMIDHLPDMPADGSAVTLVDGKTADQVKPDDQMRKKIYDYAYHRQAKTYQDAVEHLFGRFATVVFLFQSKKPPHLIVPVELDTPAQRIAAHQNHEALEIWAECVATGVWPGYTNGVAMSGVPAWIERQFEDELVIG